MVHRKVQTHLWDSQHPKKVVGTFLDEKNFKRDRFLVKIRGSVAPAVKNIRPQKKSNGDASKNDL